MYSLMDSVIETFRIIKRRQPEATDVLDSILSDITAGHKIDTFSDIEEDLTDGDSVTSEYDEGDIDFDLAINHLKADDGEPRLKYRFRNEKRLNKLPDQFNTVMYIPTTNMRWSKKMLEFSVKLLEEGEQIPTILSHITIIGVGGEKDIKATAVRCAQNFNREKLEKIKGKVKVFEDRHPLASKLEILPFMDVFVLELEKIFDMVDPHRSGFVVQNMFRKLLTLTSGMQQKKMDHMYNLLKNQTISDSHTLPGVALNEIGIKAYEYALNNMTAEKQKIIDTPEAVRNAIAQIFKEKEEKNELDIGF